ncbi:MAG: GNAT family N-acetyltransferase, partial [Actinotignum schaalii]|nr:GNAT family N-acetyltransferase [Actinotignum schaalii]
MQEFTLTTPSYFLSAPRPADETALATICADPDIQRWTTIPAGYSRSDAHAFITEFAPQKWAEGSPVWLFSRGPEYAPLGCVNVDVTGIGRMGMLGFWGDNEARNTGMVTESFR